MGMEYSDYPRPPFKREDTTPAWVTCVCSLGCVFVALVLLFPIIASSHHANNLSCLSNIRQLSVGIEMYAQDYDETLPRSARWMDDIYPYVKNNDIFRCPSITQK